MQVYGDKGNITGGIGEVMAKWKFDFNNLFQGYDNNESFVLHIIPSIWKRQ